MKKIVFAALAASLAATPAFADDVESTVVSGTVALSCTVDTPGTATLTTMEANSAAQSIGNLEVQCNSWDGYKVKARSLKNGFMEHGDAPANKFAYKVSAQGLGNSVALTSNDTTFNVPAGTAKHTVPVTVQLGALSGQRYAGTYSDTITITVAAD